MVGAGPGTWAADTVWLTGTVRLELERVTGWDFMLCWKTGSDFTATVPDFGSDPEPDSEPI